MKPVVFVCIAALLGCETVDTASTGPDVGLLGSSPSDSHLHTGRVVDSAVNVDASLVSLVDAAATQAAGFNGTWTVTRTLVATDCPPPVAQMELDTWRATNSTGLYMVTVEGDTAWPILRAIEEPAGGPDISLVGSMRQDGSRLGTDLWRQSADEYTGTEVIFVGTGCTVRRSIVAVRAS
jgi:hypothetical protein